MEAYRIADEPRPGGLAHLVVSPIWPLFGFMFCGSWLAWPWFVVNGMGVGSPTLRREVAVAAGGFAGSILLAVAIYMADRVGMLPGSTANYALLGLTVWKVGVSYWLYTLQSRTFGIYEYYGGEVKSGIWPLMVASFLLNRRLFRAIDNDTVFGSLLHLVLS